MRKVLAAVLACAVIIAAPSALASNLTEAKALFAKYGKLESEFNSSVADLYADDALIKNTRKYPSGDSREVVFPANSYKQLIRATMPLARLRRDYSTYSNIRFNKEGAAVRIQATRFSVLKKYNSPISLLVAEAPSGQWLIREELSESQP